MTKLFANFLNLMINIFIFCLPRWKRLTVKARLYDKLRPFETVWFEGKKLSLFIPDRTSVYWAKSGANCEPTTNAWINSFDNKDTFLDIGANIGLYSMMAATRGLSRVYAVEPNPYTFSVLARNVAENQFGSCIVPLNIAMAQTSSIVSFNLSGLDAGTGQNKIVFKQEDINNISIIVPSFSLDEFVHIQGISEINHIKIDVDGLEFEILQGADKTLSHRGLKTVLVEDNTQQENQKSELNMFLEQYGLQQSNVWGNNPAYNKVFLRK
jgi:FkbM family methyltransferase